MEQVKDTDRSTLKEDIREEEWCEPLTSIQKVVDALVFPEGREVKIIHQRVQAILVREERG